MVFELDIQSCSPREVLIQYLRCALIDILQQVQNGIDSDCISFRLENLIDLLLRSAHLYQDGGQVLAVVRSALTAVENRRQSLSIPFWTCCNISIRARLTYRISTSRGEQDEMSRSNTISVCSQYVLNNTA